MNFRLAFCSILLFSGFLLGCANITAPTGGRKDTTPPKMVSIDPHDSLLNTRVSRIEMHFDEYITVSDVSKEVQLSPILAIQPTVTGHNKTVIVKIVDSLLEPNTTYRLSLGSAVKDLHEGNAFKPYTYTFSTGSYFDSLQFSGNVLNAETGLADTGTYTVMLYNATENDSAVVRKKPRYITRTDRSGDFTFKGLPGRSFRLYAVKDYNSNLLYDGPGSGEPVAFSNLFVNPSDTSAKTVKIRAFLEAPDSTTQKGIDSTSKLKVKKPAIKSPQNDVLSYSVALDTANVEQRTFDLNSVITIAFTKKPVLNTDKITLTYDSLGKTISPAFNLTLDSTTHNLIIRSDWRENMVYKLRLVKGFAKDTSGTEVVPSRYTFRTKEDGDYGKINLHLPSKYRGQQYLLRVMADNDSIYQKPVTDTMVFLKRLKPAKYTFRIIADQNRNGKWDGGDLLGKKQPEDVFPYQEPVNIRQGWENTIDFEPVVAPAKTKTAAPPKQK